MEQLSIAIRSFNDKVRMMNQSNAKQLQLTAQEARSLHADIFSLLSNLAEISSTDIPATPISEINMDGGKF